MSTIGVSYYGLAPEEMQNIIYMTLTNMRVESTASVFSVAGI